MTNYGQNKKVDILNIIQNQLNFIPSHFSLMHLQDISQNDYLNTRLIHAYTFGSNSVDLYTATGLMSYSCKLEDIKPLLEQNYEIVDTLNVVSYITLKRGN